MMYPDPRQPDYLPETNNEGQPHPMEEQQQQDGGVMDAMKPLAETPKPVVSSADTMNNSVTSSSMDNTPAITAATNDDVVTTKVMDATTTASTTAATTLPMEHSSSQSNHYILQPTIVVIPGVTTPAETSILNDTYVQQLNDMVQASSEQTTKIAGAATKSLAMNSCNNNANANVNNNNSVATISAPWQYDDLSSNCYSCGIPFVPILQGKHHCRLCGHIFCHSCTANRSLIPPSRIVVVPQGGKKVKPSDPTQHVSFTPDPDPDGMLTYYTTTTNDSDQQGHQTEQLLYGKGLEQRIQLARQPLRVCYICYNQLLPIQEELRNTNSNAVRYNFIDPAAPIRMFNSPIAFTLGHEIRKAAYTLNNLLPLPKRRQGAMVSSSTTDMYHPSNMNTLAITNEMQHCKEQCVSVSPSLGDLDGVRIPTKLLQRAKGIAVLTVVKGGFGLAGAEFGTGLVVAKLPPLPNDNATNATQRWSAPSAIGTAGISWGALVGAQVSDHVFVLMTDTAVEMMFSDHNNASIQLGVDIGIAVGPLGRAMEGDISLMSNKPPAPIYTYSLSKGLYAGISLDGKMIMTRHHLNEKFYGYAVNSHDILSGSVPTPPAAQPLYEALARCQVYAASNRTSTNRQQQQPQQQSAFPGPMPSSSLPNQQHQPQPQQQQQQLFDAAASNNNQYQLDSRSLMGEYGELPEDIRPPSNPNYYL